MPDSTQPVQRVLLAGAVGHVKVKLTGVGASILRVCDSLEPHLRRSGLFEAAPFHSVHLIIQVGEAEDRKVQCGRVDRRHSELPVTVMVDRNFVLHKAPAELDKDLRQLIIDALVQVALQHNASPAAFLALCSADET